MALWQTTHSNPAAAAAVYAEADSVDKRNAAVAPVESGPDAVLGVPLVDPEESDVVGVLAGDAGAVVALVLEMVVAVVGRDEGSVGDGHWSENPGAIDEVKERDGEVKAGQRVGPVVAVVVLRAVVAVGRPPPLVEPPAVAAAVAVVRHCHFIVTASSVALSIT